jgi:hypothetical protein
MLPNVQAALVSDGWTVKKGAITIIKGNYQFFIDVSAGKDGQKVAIEVKSFLNNFVYDWHLALGQYLTYSALLFKLILTLYFTWLCPKTPILSTFKVNHFRNL